MANTAKLYNSTLPHNNAEIKLKILKNNKAKDDHYPDQIKAADQQQTRSKQLQDRVSKNDWPQIEKKLRKRSLSDAHLPVMSVKHNSTDAVGRDGARTNPSTASIDSGFSSTSIVDKSLKVKNPSLETLTETSGNLPQMSVQTKDSNEVISNKESVDSSCSQDHERNPSTEENKTIEYKDKRNVYLRRNIGVITYSELRQVQRKRTLSNETTRSYKSAARFPPHSMVYTSGKSSLSQKISNLCLEDEDEEYDIFLNTKYSIFAECLEIYKRGRVECHLCKLSNKCKGKIPRETLKGFFTADEDGDTPLHIAIVQGDIHVSMCLILRALSCSHLNMKDNSGLTPLHLCAITENVPIARLLLTKGAYVDIQDSNGDTALHMACRHQEPSLPLIQALTVPIRKDELGKQTHFVPYNIVPQDPVIKNAAGKTVLHEAVENRDVLHYLIGPPVSIDVNVQHGGTGETILHTAVKKGWQDVVLHLLNCEGIKVEAQTFSKDTALSLAFGGGFEEIAELLKKAGADEDYALWKYKGEEEFTEEENIGHDDYDPIEVDINDSASFSSHDSYSSY